MKEEKECKDCCDMQCKGEMGHHWGGMHHGRGHIFTTVGILALIYGAVNYLRVTYVWPPYTGWIAGGLALIIIGVGKKYWMNRG